MFKRKKKKTGCETPEFISKVPMPPVAKPKIKEFENCKNLIIIPKHDKLSVWQETTYIPYKDEILIAYNDLQVIYKLGDGIHKWAELPEVSLEEVIAFGYVYHIQNRYKIKLEFIPTRTMRGSKS